MQYCSSCGQTIEVGMKFCPACGSQIAYTDEATKEKRKQVFEGEVRKCPNCGVTLRAFESFCPTCGYELRATKASSVVQEFSKQLDAINVETFSPVETQRTFWRKSQKELEAEKERRTERKLALIESFPIPNTREDIIEFLILAGTNMIPSSCDENSSITSVRNAWEAKFEQAYQKAAIAFKGDKSFQEIKDLYHEKISDKKRAKRAKRKSSALDTLLGIGIFVIIVGGAIFLGYSDHIKTENKIENETERLQSIVEEIYTYIEQKQYIMARSKASELVSSSNQIAKKWDITRRQLLDVIDKAEYGADYVPGPREIRIGVSHDDLKDEDYSEVKTILENRGFTNIRTEAVEDLLTGWRTNEGSVDKVSVGGDILFSEDSIYSSDVEIIIYYHAKR